MLWLAEEEFQTSYILATSISNIADFPIASRFVEVGRTCFPYI